MSVAKMRMLQWMGRHTRIRSGMIVVEYFSISLCLVAQLVSFIQKAAVYCYCQLSFSLSLSLSCILYICVILKSIKLREKVRNFSTHLSLQVGIRAGFVRRLPPSAAVISGHFFRRDQGQVRLEKCDPPLVVALPMELPRAALISRDFWRVKPTRRRLAVRS